MEHTFEYQRLREEWKRSDTKRDEGLTIPEDIIQDKDICYGPYGEDNLADIYYQKGVLHPQPTIVSIHGGGWFYGNKEIYQFYCMNLAQRGFTVVNFNYRLAPEHRWPAALEDINALFSWIAEHGSEHCIDPDILFTVGDSAGGQLASQYLALLTNAQYRKFYPFSFPVGKAAVRAAGLNCGIYDAARALQTQTDGAMVNYVGERITEAIPAMDTMKYLTADFPPSFIMTSCHDFLRDAAAPMYRALTDLGVPCIYRCYGAEDRPEIGHVFHVNIKLSEAAVCNDEECAFFKKYIPVRA